jgi:hypothetical protein
VTWRTISSAATRAVQLPAHGLCPGPDAPGGAFRPVGRVDVGDGQAPAAPDGAPLGEREEHPRGAGRSARRPPAQLGHVHTVVEVVDEAGAQTGQGRGGELGRVLEVIGGYGEVVHRL